MRLHIGAQHLIDSGLVPLAGVPEVLEHVGIEAQRDLLLVLGRERNAGARPLGIGRAARNVAEVDFAVGHGGQVRKPCLGLVAQLGRVGGVEGEPNGFSSSRVAHGVRPFGQR